MNKILRGTFLSLLLMAFVFNSVATTKDKAKTEISDPIKAPKKYALSNTILKSNKQKIVILEKAHRKNIFIQKMEHKLVEYNYSDLQPTGNEVTIYKNGELSPSGQKLKNRYQIFPTKNGYIQFFIEYISRKKTYNYYYRTFSTDLKSDQTLKLAFKEENPRNRSTQLVATLNEDSTGIIFLLEGAKNKNDNEKLRIVQILETGEVDQSNEVELPRNARDFNFEKAYITKGNKYVVTAYTNVSKKEKNEAGYGTLHAIYLFDSDDSQAREFLPTYSDKIESVFGVKYAFSESDVKMVGFYNNRAKKGIDGLISKTFSINSETWENERVTTFTSDIIRKIESSTAIKSTQGLNKNKNGLSNNFRVINILDQKDGGSMMICQYQTSYQRCTRDSRGTTTCYTVYVFGDYLLFKFDESGKMKWFNTINRYVESTVYAPELINYPMFPEEDGVSFLMNDLSKNAGGKASAGRTNNKRNYSKTETAIAYFNSAQKPITTTIKSNGYADYFLNVNSAVRVDDDTYLMFGSYLKANKAKSISKYDQILVKVKL